MGIPTELSMRLKTLLFFFALGFAPLANGQFYNDYELEPHGYFSRKPKDPVSLLMEKVNAGKVKITEKNGKELVARLLNELNLSKDTQVLVFSKTSLQSITDSL